MHPTSSSNVHTQITEIFSHVFLGIERSLREKMNSDHGGGLSDEPEQTDDKTQMYRVSDILTIFDNNLLLEEFQDLMERASRAISLQACFTDNDLRGTVYRLSTRDAYIRRSLLSLVPADVCAVRYLEKQEARVQRSLDALSEYYRLGSAISSIAMSVPQCGRALRKIVHQVYTYQETRVESFWNDETARIFAKYLVKWLAAIVDRRETDIDTGGGNAKIAHENESDRDRNIYQYLISNPPPFEHGTERWMIDLYVLDGLQPFLKTRWWDIYRELAEIKSRVEESTDYGEPGAIVFVGKIEAVLHDYNTTTQDPGSSSAQRRMPRPDWSPKRPSGDALR